MKTIYECKLEEVLEMINVELIKRGDKKFTQATLQSMFKKIGLEYGCEMDEHKVYLDFGKCSWVSNANVYRVFIRFDNNPFFDGNEWNIELIWDWKNKCPKLTLYTSKWDKTRYRTIKDMLKRTNRIINSWQNEDSLACGSPRIAKFKKAQKDVKFHEREIQDIERKLESLLRSLKYQQRALTKAEIEKQEILKG